MKLYLVEHADSEAVVETFVIASDNESEAINKSWRCCYCPAVIHGQVLVEGQWIPHEKGVRYHATAKLIGTTVDPNGISLRKEFSSGDVICADQYED
jgi:hypothetical protein